MLEKTVSKILTYSALPIKIHFIRLFFFSIPDSKQVKEFFVHDPAFRFALVAYHPVSIPNCIVKYMCIWNVVSDRYMYEIAD